ncbi:MAG: ribonuclease R, partial [Pseudomonadota bacterium]|nr:ribonuclease R [Pseudomonadota bacterium]
MAKKPAGALPSREEILDFIRETDQPVTKREIARAFQIKGQDRVILKKILRELEAEGLVEKDQSKRLSPPGSLPSVMVLDIVGFDPDGTPMAKPVNWDDGGPSLVIRVRGSGSVLSGIKTGDRLLAKMEKTGERRYSASPIKHFEREQGRVVGLFSHVAKRGQIAVLQKGRKVEFIVPLSHSMDAKTGDLVVAEPVSGQRGGMKNAKVVKIIGNETDPRAISRVTIHSLEIPTDFPDRALREAKRSDIPGLEKREDLRDIPLVTIDGADARDYDDAIWAEADTDEANKGGWHLIVAIADVAYYVPPGGALDRAARDRGNSVYLPDMCVPMLPEALSSDLCSLLPGKPRAALAAHLWIDAHGKLVRHRFTRALMRSAACLTYEQVQAADDGHADEETAHLAESVIAPLFGAFKALAKARKKRGTLEIDLPERQVMIGEDGKVKDIRIRPRYDSHRVVEEFMIAANVAAAETLEKVKLPCVYRIHDKPDLARIESLAGILKPLGLPAPTGQVIKPALFNGILEKAANTDAAVLVHTLILRSQAKARYDPENIGHFGLALRSYAHFTSPIRRYADLIVHRLLIRELGLGSGGLPDVDMTRLDAISDHISTTERRAQQAERDAVDRFTAQYMSEHIGAEFTGRISGVTRFGLFVELNETGAQGLVPICDLPPDFYVHDDARQALVGRRWGRVYRLSAPVRVRPVEAVPL